MKSQIQLKLFATLQGFTPPSADNFIIDRGISVLDLLEQIQMPREKAKLIFINGVKAELNSILEGGERVGIFPPVGGG
jgi:molybdopterin converting factor small subunit